MTATETPSIETLSSPPPVRPPRVGVVAAGLIVFAAAALAPSLLPTSSQTETSPMTPTLAAASPQHAASGHATGRSYAPNIEPSTAYAQFCQNSPSLCAPPVATTPASTGYLQSAGTARPCAQHRNPTDISAQSQMRTRSGTYEGGPGITGPALS
jgi:hypothetical protein